MCILKHVLVFSTRAVGLLSYYTASADDPSLTCLEVLVVNDMYVGFASQVCIKFCAGLKANVASSFLLKATDLRLPLVFFTWLKTFGRYL